MARRLTMEENVQKIMPQTGYQLGKILLVNLKCLVPSGALSTMPLPDGQRQHGDYGLCLCPTCLRLYVQKLTETVLPHWSHITYSSQRELHSSRQCRRDDSEPVVLNKPTRRNSCVICPCEQTNTHTSLMGAAAAAAAGNSHMTACICGMTLNDITLRLARPRRRRSRLARPSPSDVISSRNRSLQSSARLLPRDSRLLDPTKRRDNTSLQSIIFDCRLHDPTASSDTTSLQSIISNCNLVDPTLPR